MAALTDQDRVKIWEEWMRLNADPVGAVTKLELRQVVNEIDNWFDTNKASLLAALSEPAPSELSGSQIARLASMILEKRWLGGA